MPSKKVQAKSHGKRWPRTGAGGRPWRHPSPHASHAKHAVLRCRLAASSSQMYSKLEPPHMINELGFLRHIARIIELCCLYDFANQPGACMH